MAGDPDAQPVWPEVVGLLEKTRFEDAPRFENIIRTRGGGEPRPLGAGRVVPAEFGFVSPERRRAGDPAADGQIGDRLTVGVGG